ncbi:MAG TPA: MerR family transcriptional regulator, partial [Thermoanaerobaculia bacterium]|nr:MerR family transcriptional regulator [Thermoanaerobaculia bacterium]
MIIGELARLAGLATSTVRYYEEIGLLPRAARASGRRVYGYETVNRLTVIAFAKQAGFTLAEVRQLLDGSASESRTGVRWRKLAAAKLVELEALEAQIGTMTSLLKEALRCGCVDLELCGKIVKR